MGALAPFSPWIPEDDILLRNAVEAGASLESLAKGAVHFSRRFTVRELQDRWHSLLYDPIVSADASARMIEFESSTPTLPFDKSRNAKENKCESGKRKAESVRSRYYAMRKRICNEPFNSMGLNFLITPGTNNYVGNGDEPLYGNCMTGYPTSAPFGLESSDMETIKNLMDGCTATGTVATADSFHTRFQNPAENDFHMEQDNIHEEIPHILGNDLPIVRNESEVEEFNQPKEFPDCSLFSVDDLGMIPPNTLDQINGDEGNMSAKFEGNQAFNSPVSNKGASFHNLEYSSPLPGMPIWRTCTAPAMPVDVDLKENDACTRDPFELADDTDVNNTRASEYDVQLGTEVKADIPCSDCKSPAAPASTEGYLAELSNSLLNFTNEELMLMTDEGKDVIDKSYYDGLSSLLLSSPNDDVRQEQTIGITEPETSVASVIYSMNPSSTHPGVVDDNRGSQFADEHMACHSETLMVSSSTDSNYHHPELKDGAIWCILNTEDLEIPCNDDVFLPNRFLQSSTSKVNKPISSSVNDFSVNRRNSDAGLCFMQREQRNPGEPLGSSHIKGSHFLQEMGPKPPMGNVGDKFELSKTDPTDVASKHAIHVSEGLGQICSANPSTNPLPELLKEETRESILTKRLSYNSTELHMENRDLDYNRFKSYPQTNAGDIKQDLDPSATGDHKLDTEVMPLHIAVSEPEFNPQTSDQLGLFESDDDVPCYSDIEAMILDMDLDPHHQNFYSNEEVLRYQHEVTKKGIIRLEQGACSYLHRDIASHGAFAILYGRHSKHYIKKPEVLLGRATEDDTVDIDLGREGRNKISRKQAIIMMDKGGSFYLKNLGKFSISVNSKEVAPGQSLTLISSCLIEIRGMPFLFDTNQTRVKQYLDSITRVGLN